MPFFAEDLGYITPEVHALRERLQIPGMAVLQFGFNNPGAHIYLPHRLTPNSVIYTGTHDNDTTLGWWNSIDQNERNNAHAYLGAPYGIYRTRDGYLALAMGRIPQLSALLGCPELAEFTDPDGNHLALMSEVALGGAQR